jgi:hypothetical protein
MIHPRAEVVDLDAPLWGDISLAVQRCRLAGQWAYVLHHHGVVVTTLPADLRSAPLGDAVTDPRALARAVREETGRVRAVVLDERGLDAVVVAATASARPERTQAELRADVAAVYWSSGAVVADPAEPPDDPRLRIGAALRSAAPRQRAILRVLREGSFAAAVALDIEDGLITRVVCVDAAEAASSAQNADLWADVEWSGLMDAIAAAEPWPAFADLLDAAPAQRGLEPVRSALRGGQPAAV